MLLTHIAVVAHDYIPSEVVVSNVFATLRLQNGYAVVQ